ncbi:MAG: DUF1588 domain-containing protein, partial [Polyangiaceae bacterium]|nr:DUF1588 domain-containing protein [Polyangiaceae bacterium]
MMRLQSGTCERVPRVCRSGAALLTLLALQACSSQPIPGDVVAAPEAAPTATVAVAAVDLAPSALRRLSRDELLTSMQVLVGAAPPRAELPSEPRAPHQLLRTSAVPFIQTELAKLYETIKAFAAAQAPAILKRTGCTQTGQAQRDCLRSWSKGFAELVLRRPERPEEEAKYLSILSTADGTAEADQGAIKWLLGALLYSPSFVYRTEIGTPLADAPSRRMLTPSELSAKLSFLSTLGPPDAELQALATAGALAEGGARIAEFERLRNTANGKRALSVMLHEWLGANESKVALKSAVYQMGLTPTFPLDIRAQADTFIAGILSGSEPTVGNLLTSASYVSDPVLAQITRASLESGVSTGDVPAYPRIGLLMHPQVLSAHTKDNGASPFQVGIFLKSALLCEQVGVPPEGATDLARTDAPAGLSMRETLDYKTSAQPVCTACHATFAPLGYAFMAFDPVGR